MFRLSKHEIAASLSVGDRVFSDFHRDEGSFVRVITKIVKNSSFGSGYGAAASKGLDENGVPRFGNSIKGFSDRSGLVDACWFRPVGLEVAEELMK
jgi:hypothetical protein